MAGEGCSSPKKEDIDHQKKAKSRSELERWLNKSMRIKMTDGRTLIGIFLCTDCDCNIIMGSCEEYLKPQDSIPQEDPRILGLAMVPGKHVVSVEIDDSHPYEEQLSSINQNSSSDTTGNSLEGDKSQENVDNEKQDSSSYLYL